MARPAFLATALTLALVVSAGAQSPAVAGMRLGTDSFVVRFHGLPEGSHVQTLARDGDGYRYTEVLSLSPMMSRTVIVLMDDSLRVTSSWADGTLGQRRFGSEITYDGRRARGRILSLQNPNALPIPVDTVLPARALDGLALYPILLSRSWQIGTADTLFVFDVDEISITGQTIRVVGAAQVQVPAGSFRALKVELSTTQLPVTLWITEARPHRLLKVESENGESVLVR